jgi:selenocysteine-specific elongation factor
MIVGTAGHIDHGKTTLVRAITGIDTDRLPEEKQRGITIELGHAPWVTPDGHRVSFVDVPGHEKLVRTMVAGASGIDCALILVAADDGVMPQTLEHTAILSLLGVQRGAAVITKIDRVAPGALPALRQTVVEMLAAHGLAHFPVLAVSAVQGTGLPLLQNWLQQQARLPNERAVAHHGFRMGLDRVFTLDGLGTVVAGSIQAGEVTVGDSLCLAHDERQAYRVRSLQTHGEPVMQARAGARCAMVLVGLERRAVARGMALCVADLASTTQRLDVCLQLLPSEAQPLRSGTRVHALLGTQAVMATVAVLGQAQCAPGQSSLAQLVTQQAVQACWGDAVVLRDVSAQRTVGGARVLDPRGPTRYRQSPQRLALLHDLRHPDPSERCRRVLQRSPQGLMTPAWLRDQGLIDWPLAPEQWPDVFHDRALGWLIWRPHLEALLQRVEQVLAAHHQQHPQDMGPEQRRVRNMVAPRMAPAMWGLVLHHLQTQGRMLARHGFLCLPAHGERLRQADQMVAQRVLPLLLDGRFDPPWVRDMVGATRMPEAQIRSVLLRLARTAEVYQVVKDLFYHPAAVHELAQRARQLQASEGAITAARFRDATGLGRKRAIQILEFFDRAGWLRRVGDRHLVRPGADLFQDPPPRGLA